MTDLNNDQNNIFGGENNLGNWGGNNSNNNASYNNEYVGNSGTNTNGSNYTGNGSVANEEATTSNGYWACNLDGISLEKKTKVETTYNFDTGITNVQDSNNYTVGHDNKGVWSTSGNDSNIYGSTNVGGNYNKTNASSYATFNMNGMGTGAKANGGAYNGTIDNNMTYRPVAKEKSMTKQGLWTKIKAFLFQEIDLGAEIKVELTPYQQKVEKEINDFLHQDVSLKAISKLFK